jgi:hypothetical protein
MKLVWIFVILGLFSISIGITEIHALSQVAGKIVVEINPGETKTFKWTLLSDSDADTTVSISASGKGAQFLSFPQTIAIGPRQATDLEVTVTIPHDHPGDIELNPMLLATEFGEKGGTTIINVQMMKIPSLVVAPNENPEFRSNEAYDLESTQIQDENDLTTQNPNAAEPEASQEAGQTVIVNPATQVVDPEPEPTCDPGTHLEKGLCVPDEKEKGGGCLIATAAFGSELAPQVQQLRELRDNYLMKTESGTSFMTGFNQFYYSFSPTIADWERQNPVFKEAVKIGITPLLTSLSILNYVDMDSEAEVLGYGIILILMNIGMYIVAPIGIGVLVVSRKSEK